MKIRHLEYFVAAAEELNFTHAADRLHVSQPPFSKQIRDLEGELGIELFDRQRKGVALTPAGKAFLVDARRILEDCEASIRKAQRISRGEIGELAIGYMSALTHEFFSKALEVWRQTAPGIVVDCIEMDSVSQERALLEGRISVGILVPSDRPVLELLHVRLLIKYPVSLALPKSHAYADKPQIPLSLLKEERFIGLNRMYPNYGDWLSTACRRSGFKPRIVKEADGAASALAFVAAGFGVAVVGEPLRKIPAKDVIFRDLATEEGAWVPVGAAWKPDGVTASVVSKFVDVLAQTCAGANGGSQPPGIKVKQRGSRQG
ncbi:MAG TPA: LysR substrate-binding domain-containing protein [Chthoniobacterales bacterium]|nr:LysR substrate-binding domain-containing protein [Chthoniobacterales bacterium]